MESERRLHPASVLFAAVTAVRASIVPALFAIFVARSVFGFLLLVVPAAFGAIAGLLTYATYRYTFRDDELVVRRGIFFKQVRNIPYARIQNVNLARNPLHRALGVADVQIETASGDKPEATMRVLSLDAVDELRRLSERTTAVPDAEGEAAPEAPPLVELSLREVALCGLISNRGLVLVGALLGVLTQMEPWDYAPELFERLPGVAEGFASRTESVPPWMSVVVGLGLAGVGIASLAILSTLWGIVQFHGFRLTRNDDRLRTEYGLFTRIQATIPLRRIQLLATRQGPLQRLVDRVTVLAKTAGSTRQSGDADESTVVRRPWLAPIYPAAAAPRLLETVLPDLDADALDWQPLAPNAARRVRKRIWIACTLLALPLVWPLKFWVLPIWLVACGFADPLAKRYVNHCGWALGERVVTFRRGWWIRRLAVVRIDKIQGVSIRETPFDRRHAMASLAIDTAGSGAGWRTVEIPLILAETAEKLRDRLYRETARTAFRW